MATASASAVGKLSREEFRRQKDLDAARKAGTAPAALDEEGHAINPHIPQYISQAPWYLDSGRPSLSHQRRPKEETDDTSIDTWYDRGKKVGPAATKYRKGACENCGAMTHKKQDCLERPRKKGAKYTNKQIAPDEVIQDLKIGYDAKRDRWNGYDASEHKKIYEEYAAVENARQKMREDQIDNQTTTDMAVVKKVAKVGRTGESGGVNDEFGSSDEEGEDEDKYADAADAVGQKLDTKTRITVRNLRIREDTAKYLINLDPDSAYYDPKTRSMRDAPHENVRPEDALFAGDNFLRHSGDTNDIQKLQLYAWQSAARGNDVHINANPTQGEILHKQFNEKKVKLKDTTKSTILSRYGGEEYLEKVPKELLQGQTEHYVEYSQTGQVIKGMEPAKAKSKYDEDVFPGNHTSVWGSWYSKSTGQWGFTCCHSTMIGSYCTGAAGIEAAAASSTANLLKIKPTPARASPSPPPADDTATDQKTKDDNRIDQSAAYSKKRLGEEGMKIDKEKLEKALREERKRKNAREDEMDNEMIGDRKRKKKGGNLGDKGYEVTEEEMEAYRMNRSTGEDPMANYVDEEL
ncbi:mRNA splicing protein [Tulasnella sp. JGI-2019a]|nr:mRNA splicing protein [Tulasnella sp. JGI-2019a]